ncbi:MAG TPA: hypothetical protein VIP28_09155 [Nocardioides sp.]
MTELGPEPTDQEPRALVIKAALQAGMAPGVPVYDLDEVPGAEAGSSADPATPPRYVWFELSRRWVEKKRLGGWVSVPGGALATHYHAPSVTGVRELRRRVTAVLEGQAYDLPDGDTVGPFEFEDDGAAVARDGGWSAFDDWTY